MSLFFADSVMIHTKKAVQRKPNLKFFNQKTCEWNALNFLDRPGPRTVLCSKPGKRLVITNRELIKWRTSDSRAKHKTSQGASALSL